MRSVVLLMFKLPRPPHLQHLPNPEEEGFGGVDFGVLGGAVWERSKFRLNNITHQSYSNTVGFLYLEVEQVDLFHKHNLGISSSGGK